jgi:hypothetical protein
MGGGIVSNLTNTAKAGFTGALGALGLDILWGYGSPYLPPTLTVATPGTPNYFMYFTKAVGAVLIGMLGGKVLRGKGPELARGAMTVVIHDILKSTLQQFMPTVPLGSYVSSSPIVAYGATPVGVPQLGVPLATHAVPSAHAMGVYTHLSGFVDGADGTEW